LSTNPADRLTGWIDGRRRPLVNVRLGDGKIVCALVDTGFNGYLLWEGSVGGQLGFPGELSPLYRPIEVAGGKILANLGMITIQWFHDLISIETLVATTTAKQHRSGDPVLFIGTALLSGMSLFVDFLNGSVHIERSR